MAPSRSLAKAIMLPSGDHTGAFSMPDMAVMRRASPPRAGTVNRSPLYLNTTVLPSGETFASLSQRGESAPTADIAVATAAANMISVRFIW